MRGWTARITIRAAACASMCRILSEIVEETVGGAIFAARQPGIGRFGAHEHRQSGNGREQRASAARLRRRKARGPRICDLNYLIAWSRGKIEMTLAEEEGAEDKLIRSWSAKR